MVRKSIESDHAEQLGGMRRVDTEQIIEAPHALRQRRSCKHPTASKPGKAVGFGEAAGSNEI